MTSPNPPDPNAGAAEEQAGAGAGTAGVGAQSRSASTGAASDVVQDIGQGELYTMNLKMVGASEFGHLQRLAGYAELALKDALGISNQVAQNAVVHSNALQQNNATHQHNQNTAAHAEQNRTIRAGDVATDRIWNIDEQTQVVGQIARSVETSIRTADLASVIGVAVAAALREANKK